MATTAARQKKGAQRDARIEIRLSTLEAVCKALECQPGDIIEYKKKRIVSGSHRVHDILR
ncbi:MAG: helix-turn-helix domain-containing protein [Burkholderiales bacterium]